MEFKEGDFIRNIDTNLTGVVIKTIGNSIFGESVLEVRYNGDIVHNNSIDYLCLFEPDYQKIREIKINEILNGIS